MKNIGIDMGTTTTRVYVSGKGVTVKREPTVVAVNTHTNQAKYIGREAQEVIGRSPGSIVAVCPLKNGVIADFDTATILLQEIIRKAIGGGSLSRAQVLLSIPSGITPVEQRAVRDAANCAGARTILLVEAPIAAAVGAGLPVCMPEGSMVLDIGGGTTEVAVISLGGIVSVKSIRVAGKSFDTAIINCIKSHYNVLIGERSAERIKIDYGSAASVDRDKTFEVKGRNVSSGLPEKCQVSTSEIRDVLQDPLSRIVDAVKYTLEQIPPELSADLIRHGITLTGAASQLRGLDFLLHKETGLDVYPAKVPAEAVVTGTGIILENLEKYRDAVIDVTK